MIFCCIPSQQETQTFLHPHHALSLTQMILGAEQTCEPQTQPGHWITWKDLHVWLGFSQRNTHFYCFSLLLMLFWPSCTAGCARAEPGLGRARFVQSHPNRATGIPVGAEMPFPGFSSQIPQLPAQGSPRTAGTASPSCKPDSISTSSFSLDSLAGIPGSCRVWTHPAPSPSRVFLLQAPFQEDLN